MIGVIVGLLLGLVVTVMSPLLLLGLAVTVYALMLLVGIVEALGFVVVTALVPVDACTNGEADPMSTVTTLPFDSVVVEARPQTVVFAGTLEVCANAVVASCGILEEV